MSYVITDGERFISTNGGLKTVYSAIQAIKFKDLDKANNFKRHLPKWTKNGGWRCEEFNSEVELSNSLSTEETNESYDSFDGLTDNLYSVLLDFENYIQKLKEYRKTFSKKIVIIEKEVMDVEHLMELEDLNMYEAWKAYKIIQDARKRRRKIKDDDLLIEHILNHTVSQLTSENNKTTTLIHKLENRKYAPRALPELFKK